MHGCVPPPKIGISVPRSISMSSKVHATFRLNSNGFESGHSEFGDGSGRGGGCRLLLVVGCNGKCLEVIQLNYFKITRSCIKYSRVTWNQSQFRRHLCFLLNYDIKTLTPNFSVSKPSEFCKLFC